MKRAGISFRRSGWAIVGASAGLLVVGGCGESTGPAETARATASARSEGAAVAVSSPYLEAAVHEVLGREVRLLRLAGPSMCPGHFDMRPSQIRDLGRCSLLVRFDFQESLDKKLGERSRQEQPIVAVRTSGGLCVPDNYVSACRQIADHFVSTGAMTRRQAEERLSKLDRRMAALRNEVGRQVDAAQLRGTPVLSSGHQADFCRWLGLRVVGQLSSADTAGISDIEKSIRDGQTAGVRLIVANEPEGRQSADALADRLRARVVVFANFPSPDGEQPFDALVRGNLSALLDTAKLSAGQP
jgi:zinc transport system substrate-binding protein